MARLKNYENKSSFAIMVDEKLEELQKPGPSPLSCHSCSKPGVLYKTDGSYHNCLFKYISNCCPKKSTNTKRIADMLAACGYKIDEITSTTEPTNQADVLMDFASIDSDNENADVHVSQPLFKSHMSSGLCSGIHIANAPKTHELRSSSPLPEMFERNQQPSHVLATKSNGATQSDTDQSTTSITTVANISSGVSTKRMKFRSPKRPVVQTSDGPVEAGSELERLIFARAPDGAYRKLLLSNSHIAKLSLHALESDNIVLFNFAKEMKSRDTRMDTFDLRLAESDFAINERLDNLANEVAELKAAGASIGKQPALFSSVAKRNIPVSLNNAPSSACNTASSSTGTASKSAEPKRFATPACAKLDELASYVRMNPRRPIANATDSAAPNRGMDEDMDDCKVLSFRFHSGEDKKPFRAIRMSFSRNNLDLSIIKTMFYGRRNILNIIVKNDFIEDFKAFIQDYYEWSEVKLDSEFKKPTERQKSIFKQRSIIDATLDFFTEQRSLLTFSPATEAFLQNHYISLAKGLTGLSDDDLVKIWEKSSSILANVLTAKEQQRAAPVNQNVAVERR